MDTIRIITRYFEPKSLGYHILSLHSQAVTRKAVGIAIRLNLTEEDIEFIQEASMLHDIGIYFTAEPDIGCFGHLPYICHGYKGHNLLLSEGLPRHALVCERHTGTGLTLPDIDKMGGLLPRRPMEPVTIPEKLITYCDKFFSKDPQHLEEERPFTAILESIGRFGEDKLNIFKEWHHQFSQ
jgi:uncharacterized protein